jgi:ribosomal protein S18 acetylase RimI-like enzyme
MVPKVVIRDLSAHRLYRTNIKCIRCSFWFDQSRINLLDEIMGIRNYADLKYFLHKRLSRKIYQEKDSKKLVSFSENGGIVKGAFKNKRCIGIIIAGDPELFPKLRSFRVFPPDPESTFLGCIYVEPDMRGSRIEKMLLLDLEKDLLSKNIAAIETIGKRFDDDMEKEEFENSPLVSFKFLINNGFYLKKNDERYPLLRLDLKSIAGDLSKEALRTEEIDCRKAARQPVIMRENNK